MTSQEGTLRRYAARLATLRDRIDTVQEIHAALSTAGPKLDRQAERDMHAAVQAGQYERVAAIREQVDELVKQCSQESAQASHRLDELEQDVRLTERSADTNGVPGDQLSDRVRQLRELRAQARAAGGDDEFEYLPHEIRFDTDQQTDDQAADRAAGRRPGTAEAEGRDDGDGDGWA